MLLIENVSTKKIVTVQSCLSVHEFAKKLKDYTCSPWDQPTLINWLKKTHETHKTIEVRDENFLYTFI